MKIVNRTDFLLLPEGTVFTKYKPCEFGELCIKGRTLPPGDFLVQQLADALDADDSEAYIEACDKAENGIEVKFDFHCESRDGLFDKDQLFAVWLDSDIDALVSRLVQRKEGENAP